MKLVYLGRFLKNVQASCEASNPRMWNVIEPQLPGYDYKMGYPTFSIAGLRQQGLIKGDR